ncbi:PCLO protein, partial [Polyodon spathula]|nr:PCLO protein [Polyodon spathula]
RKPEVGETHQPRQPGKPPDQGSSGITKSQTTNVFKTEKPKPGRSPSSISLLESQSRPEVNEDPKATMMSSFLSEGNPLSAMSSVVNKFSLFGDAEETQKGAQQPGPTKTGPQQQGPAKPPLQQPDHRKDPSKQESRSSQSQGPSSSSTPAHKKTLCPLCTTTELLLHTPEKANYNTCTQCHIVVCSQCGFNPNPHMTEVNEWLCLNCQVQRAMGMDVSGPPMAKPQPQQPRQQVTPSSPQKTEPNKAPEPKKPAPLTKQQSMSSSPPIKPKEPWNDSSTQKPAQQKGSIKPDPSRPQEDSKQKQTEVQKTPDQTTSPAPGIKQASQVPQGPPPTHQKQLTQVEDSTKPASQAPKAGVKQMQPESQKSGDPTKQMQTQLKETANDVTPKTDPKTGSPVLEPAKSEQPAQVHPIQQPPKAQEQSRRFSLNIGGVTETPKPQPATPQETVTGKLFGFGSFFSQASNLINMADKPAEQPAPVAKQQPPSEPVNHQQPPKEASSAQSSPKLPPAKKETQPQVAQKPEQPVVGKAPASGQEATKTVAGSTAPPAPPKSNCPLCKVELNIGSKDPPNFNTCTECKNMVCNLCGFNPMPHLTEVRKHTFYIHN